MFNSDWPFQKVEISESTHPIMATGISCFLNSPNDQRWKLEGQNQVWWPSILKGSRLYRMHNSFRERVHKKKQRSPFREGIRLAIHSQTSLLYFRCFVCVLFHSEIILAHLPRATASPVFISGAGCVTHPAAVTDYSCNGPGPWRRVTIRQSWRV